MIRVAIDLPRAARWRIFLGAEVNVDFLRSASGVRAHNVSVDWKPKFRLPDWKRVKRILRRKGLRLATPDTDA